MDDCDPNTVLHVSVMKDTNKDDEPNKDPCPICLSFISQHSSSYLDRCFHRFCYKCILRWIQVVSSSSTSLRQPSSVKCPLCKKLESLHQWSIQRKREHQEGRRPLFNK